LVKIKNGYAVKKDYALKESAPINKDGESASSTVEIVQAADLEGELYKQGSKVKMTLNWKPRWAVLKDARLFYFKQKPKLVKIISLFILFYF